MDYDALKAFTNNEIEPYLQNIEMWQCIAALGIKPSKDGNQWSFLYGDNIQEGICGFGGTKEEALIAFMKELIEERDKKSAVKLKVGDELYEHIRNTCACIDDAYSTETLADMIDYLSTARRSAQSAFDMIEKQDEQKPADKVEPKFKVGDVIRQTDKPEYTYTIREIKDGCYICDTCDFSTDNPLLELVKKQEWSEEDVADAFKEGIAEGYNELLAKAWDETTIKQWFIVNVDSNEPVWTDAHIEELCKDFIIIKKEE